jgi:hypothetical protein
MTINDPTVGIMVFLGAMLINRVLGERALKRLNAEEKARLLDSFSGYRIYGTMVLVILALFYFAVSKTSPQLRFTLARGFFGLLVLSSLVTSLLSYLKLKSLDLPQFYVNNFLVRSGLYFTGLMFLVFTFVSRYFL